MLENKRSKDRYADGDEVGDGIIGLGQLVDPFRQELKRALRECVNEEPLLRSEEAVDGPRCGADVTSDGAN